MLPALACDDSTGPSENPVPGITGIDPQSATAGLAELTLTVEGNDFVSRSTVLWNGTTRPTTYVSKTRLTATIDQTALAAPGAKLITVNNPTPGGGTSNALTFSLLPGLNPRPTLTSLTPDTATVGSAPRAVVLTGTSFMTAATVFFNSGNFSTNFSPPVTYVSPTQLTVTIAAERLASAGAYQVTVSNPFPGGGPSEPRTFSVRTPVPIITSVSDTVLLAGADADTLEIEGTGFYAGSEVRFGGAIRATAFVSPTRLRVILVSGDLAAPGSFDVTVVNAAPGGGTSAPRSVRVVAGTPTIVGLPASGGQAGRPGFSLAVDGRHFVSGAVVQWNGVDRPTTFRHGTRLLAAISSDDVASPGIAHITVRNPGVATVSNAVDFTVRALMPAAITSQRVVELNANDVIYEPVSALLYASVPSAGGIYGNSIVAIDPTSGQITRSVFVGSEPEIMAVSDDGQYLYVSLRGSSSVRRVNLGAFTAGLEFALGAGSIGSAVIVEEILVVPGSPRKVVLSKRNLCCSPRHEGVFVYDDGVQLGASTPGHTGSNSIAFSGRPGSLLYGFNNETTDAGFRTMVIDGAGVRITHTVAGIVGGGRILGGGGRIYGTNGGIVDPEMRIRTGGFAMGSLSGPNGLHVAPELGRAFFLAGGLITAFDINTMQEIGSVVAPGSITEHPYGARLRLAHWGIDGLAYRDGTRVYILRTTLAAP